jgi:FHA domain
VDAPERALRRLRDAYGAGQVSTATLEARTAAVLSGHIEDAIWDLPRRRRQAAPVRSLVAGEREWPLAERGRWVLGRSADCDVVIDGDDAVSRRHAEIAVRAGECRIRDLDSCNGTLLNGHLVEQACLRRGDVLVFGETTVRVR